jgi:hypothetical protein
MHVGNIIRDSHKSHFSPSLRLRRHTRGEVFPRSQILIFPFRVDRGKTICQTKTKNPGSGIRALQHGGRRFSHPLHPTSDPLPLPGRHLRENVTFLHGPSLGTRQKSSELSGGRQCLSPSSQRDLDGDQLRAFLSALSPFFGKLRRIDIHQSRPKNGRELDMFCFCMVLCCIIFLTFLFFVRCKLRKLHSGFSIPRQLGPIYALI